MGLGTLYDICRCCLRSVRWLGECPRRPPPRAWITPPQMYVCVEAQTATFFTRVFWACTAPRLPTLPFEIGRPATPPSMISRSLIHNLPCTRWNRLERGLSCRLDTRLPPRERTSLLNQTDFLASVSSLLPGAATGAVTVLECQASDYVATIQASISERKAACFLSCVD